MKRNKIFSRFFGDTDRKYKLVDITQQMASFYFNARMVHLYTGGENFLEIHNYAEELYSKMEEFYDDFAETAISYDEKVPPMNVTPGNFSVINDVPSEYDTIIGIMLNDVRQLFDNIENLDKDIYASFVSSKCDTVLEWLDKQNYKLTRMSKEIM